MAIKLQIKPEPGWGGHTTYNLAFPAGGIRRPPPPPDIGGRGGGGLAAVTGELTSGVAGAGTLGRYPPCAAPKSFKNQYPDSENENVTSHDRRRVNRWLKT